MTFILDVFEMKTNSDDMTKKFTPTFSGYIILNNPKALVLFNGERCQMYGCVSDCDSEYWTR